MATSSSESSRHSRSSRDGQLFSEKLKFFRRSFKRLWWISAVCGMLFASLSFAYFHVTYRPMYKSDVKFTITPLVSSNAESGASVYSFNYNSTLAKQMAETFPYIINSGIMGDTLRNDLKRSVNGMISADAVKDTNIFKITVESPSPQDAYDIVNSIIKNYPKVAEYVIGDTKMNVIEGAEPKLADEPYNKGDYYGYVVLLGVLGITIGIVATLIDMKVKKTVINRRDIESYFNGKCVCEIPTVKKKRTSKDGAMIKISQSLSGFSEAIRVLKQRVRGTLKSNGTKVVGVTSAVHGEGKTTVAYNLAKALSNSDEKVILIDMDLHGRNVQKYLNRKQEVSNVGISEVVVGKAQVSEVVNSISDNLDVLFAGEEMVKFNKDAFASVFEYAREHYDYVIVDMATCSLASETVLIGDLCDEMLFVVRSNTISPDKVYNSLKDMAFSDVRMMGFIVNCVNPGSDLGGYKYYGRYGRRRYGYGYGYGYSNYGRGHNYRRSGELIAETDHSDGWRSK